MKNRILKPIFVCLAFVTLMASFASCNKGYGCPSNFSVKKVAVEAAATAVQAAAATVVKE